MMPTIARAHALGLRRVAARLLLDHALEHARDERDAGGLDRLQVARREQPRQRRIARALGRVGEHGRQRRDARQRARAAHRGRGIRRGWRARSTSARPRDRSTRSSPARRPARRRRRRAPMRGPPAWRARDRREGWRRRSGVPACGVDSRWEGRGAAADRQHNRRGRRASYAKMARHSAAPRPRRTRTRETTMTPTSAQESAAQFLFAARTNAARPFRAFPPEFRPADVDGGARDPAARRANSSASRSAAGSARCPRRRARCSPRRSSRRRSVARVALPGASAAAACAKIEPEIAFVLGARPAAARDAVQRGGGARRASREARFVLELIGARYTDPSGRRLSRAARRRRRQPGALRRARASPNAVRAHARGVSRSRSRARRHGARARATASTRTAIRCGRCTGSRTTWPAQGTPLRAGQIVTTGSYCGVRRGAGRRRRSRSTYGDLGDARPSRSRAA